MIDFTGVPIWIWWIAAGFMVISIIESGFSIYIDVLKLKLAKEYNKGSGKITQTIARMTGSGNLSSSPSKGPVKPPTAQFKPKRKPKDPGVDVTADIKEGGI